MIINITAYPSDYRVTKWDFGSFPTNAEGSPVSEYKWFRPKSYVQELTCPRGHTRTIRRHAETRPDTPFYCEGCCLTVRPV
jgi:hypothetical protein